MNEVVTSCSGLTDSVHINLQCRPALIPDVAVRADLDAIKDVFINLIRDSIAFHAQHRPVVTIQYALRDYPGPNAQLVISYKDDGPGIRTEWKDRIFEPFVTTREDGTGIGLADAKNIIHSHKGNIREIGILGRGIHFEITLPLHLTERQA
jgi:signal transduction histidine kinase